MKKTFILSILLVLQLICFSQNKYYFRGGDTTINGGLGPDDTLVLNNTNGYLGQIDFYNCRGTSGHPIVIMNDPTKDSAAMFRGVHSRLQTFHCQYIKFSGKANPSIQYGLDIKHFPDPYLGRNSGFVGADYFPIAFQGRSRCIELEGYHCRMVSTGIVIKQDPDPCIDSLNYQEGGFVMDSFLVHDNFIEKVFNEGMYLGNTLPDNDPAGYQYNDTKRTAICGVSYTGAARYSAVDSTIRVQGNRTAIFIPGYYFRAEGASGNNALFDYQWRVKPSGSTYVGDTTIIKVTNIDLSRDGSWMNNANYTTITFYNAYHKRPMRVGLTGIYRNRTDSTGRAGLQYGGGNQSLCNIYDNKVTHTGVTGQSGQLSGISLGTYTNVHIYRDTVIVSGGEAIHSTTAGMTNITQVIENCYLDSIGYLSFAKDAYNRNGDPLDNFDPYDWLADAANNFAAGVAIRTRTMFVQDSFRFIIRNNKMGLTTIHKQTTWDGKKFAPIILENGRNLFQITGNSVCSNTDLTGHRLFNGVDTLVLLICDPSSGCTVNAVFDTAACPGNLNPVAIAGSDQSISISTVNLDGSSSYDPDGTIVAYAWTKISGTGGTITSPSTASTTVTGLTSGVYVFQLRVYDNLGDTNTDQVTITVSATSNGGVIIRHKKTIGTGRRRGVYKTISL